MTERDRGSVAPASPLFVGAVAAAVASTQDNRGRAVLDVVADAGISRALVVPRTPTGA